MLPKARESSTKNIECYTNLTKEDLTEMYKTVEYHTEFLNSAREKNTSLCITKYTKAIRYLRQNLAGPKNVGRYIQRAKRKIPTKKRLFCKTHLQK